MTLVRDDRTGVSLDGTKWLLTPALIGPVKNEMFSYKRVSHSETLASQDHIKVLH